MHLPKIDFSSLPNLETLVGLVDALRVQTSNDTIAILITFLYELDPTRGLF